MALFVGYAVAGDVVPAAGGLYVEGIVGTPRYLNPLLAQPGSVDDDVVALVFAGLTRVSSDGEVRPDLASEWSVDATGRTYTFRLRSGLRWHDGQHVSGEDVVATVRALQAAEFPGDPALAALWRGVNAEATTEGVRLTLPEPNSWFPEQASIGIVPSRVANALRGRAGLELEVNQKPIGAGPFRVVSAELRRIDLVAWEEHHERGPYLGGLELRFFGAGEAAAAALRRGELTAVRPLAMADVAAAAAAQGGLAVHQRAERAKTVALAFNTRASGVADAATRAALGSAIDRARVASTQMAAVAAEGARPAGAQAAREALERAGWRADAAGTLTRNGQPLRVSVVTNDRPERVAAAEEVARQLTAAGAHAEVQAVGWSGMVADVLVPGRFQAAVVEMFDPLGDPASFWRTGAALNVGGWASLRGDELLMRARAAREPSARAAALAEWQQLFQAEAPAVALFHPRLTYLVASELRGQQVAPFRAPRDRFEGVREWYLFTRRAPGRF